MSPIALLCLPFRLFINNNNNNNNNNNIVIVVSIIIVIVIIIIQLMQQSHQISSCTHCVPMFATGFNTVLTGLYLLM